MVPRSRDPLATSTGDGRLRALILPVLLLVVGAVAIYLLWRDVQKDSATRDVLDKNTTILIEPGYAGEVDRFGNVLITPETP